MKQSKIKAEKREKKKKVKMLVSGKSVFRVQNIIIKKAKKNEIKKPFQFLRSPVVAKVKWKRPVG